MTDKEGEEFWENLEEACRDAGELWEVTNYDGTTCKVQHKMKYAPEFGPLRDGVKEP